MILTRVNYRFNLENNKLSQTIFPPSIHSPHLDTDKTSLRCGSPTLNEISPLKIQKYFPPINKELLVNTLANHNQDTILDKSNMISNNKDYFSAAGTRKYPIRNIESTSVLKRYGNYWSNNFNVESLSHYKKI